MRRPWRRILGLAALPATVMGCTTVGALTQASVQILQLALSLAAMALPFLAWYYYHRHQD